ncbi:MAG: choice-of-anchor I family protein, partial [Flavobacteriaceae bacterium]|nr:choice-of-anchor I family protein [Flavobacteriaceae bacterium]
MNKIIVCAALFIVALSYGQQNDSLLQQEFSSSVVALTITEIFPGQSGPDLTADWFEIKNTGVDAWVSGVDEDLYYDDESADPTKADLIQGITEIQPNASVIILVGDSNDIMTFTNVWSPVLDLSSVQIGYTDGAGLGSGGDAVNIWLGDPSLSAPIATASYPETSANDGQSYDSDLSVFSIIGNANGAVETIALGGSNVDVPNIGSPGDGLPNVSLSVQFEVAFSSISENGNSIEISVTPSDAPNELAAVDVVLIAGTAEEGTDFNYGSSQTLFFPIGQTGPQSVTIPITDNSSDGGDLFFVLQLQNGNNLDIGGIDTFSAYILDDDTDVPEGDASEISVTYLTSYDVDTNGTAEITAYDAGSQQLFVANADKIEVLDFSDPANISSLSTINVSDFGGESVQSIASSNGLVAAAISVNPATDSGIVVISDANGDNAIVLEVGVLPDMLIFTPDGTMLLVANEGQPSEDYTIDPEGSVSVIDVSGGLGNISQANVTTLSFNTFDGQQSALEAAGVRIYGPGASVSQDLEPEYIAVANDSQTAYVSLQENNAYAIIDLVNLEITEVLSFGLKDHSLVSNSLDLSDESGFIFDANWPVKGMYMPDAIAFYEVSGIQYIVTANEGDSRDYNAYSEERKIGDNDYILDTNVFSDIE